MATVKEQKQIRENVYGVIEDSLDTMLNGMKVLGRTSEGVLFETDSGDLVVLRCIVKKEDADAEVLLEDYRKKMEKDEAKAKEKAEKAEKRKEKGE